MRAAVARDGKTLAIERRPVPSPAAGEVRIRVLGCGICGTDLHMQHAGLWAPGHTPGHEMMGEVAECGDGVSALAVGDRVAVEPLVACGRCRPCREGRYNVCPEVRLFGIHLPGGFAEQIVVPAARAHRVPDALSVAEAALAEPMAVVVHGLRHGGFDAGQRVLVLGAGTIGLLGVLAARNLGAGEIWLSARYEHQAELGRALGAARVLREDEARPEALGSADVDLVLETVGGTANTIRAAIAAIRPGGVVSVLGLFSTDVAVPPYAMLVKEGTLRWSNCYGRTGPRPDFDEAIAILERERGAIAPVTSHALPLDEVAGAFELASKKSAGVVKVTLLTG